MGVWARIDWTAMGAFLAWWQRESRDALVKAEFAPQSPWVELEVKTPLGLHRYVIWNRTGKLYRVDGYGAVAADPIEVEELP